MKKSERFSLPRAISFTVLFLLVWVFFNEAVAQPQLNFKRIINNWPVIELYFSVGCNGQPAYFTDKKFFKVYENGFEIGDFDLWCPNPTVPCRMSVSLVFDASGSMAGAGNAGAKAGGNAFVDLMDGVNDEASVLWFNTAVTVALGMTTSKSMLKQAINSLPASGGTAVWNGIYDGVMELIANGQNQCRAVIAMTDGMNNAGNRTPAEIISFANRNRIRVFTIGLGGPIDETSLRIIADQTGGRYYATPNPSQLAVIYEEIYSIILQGFQECMITYNAKCMDGALRTVDLSLLNFCGGSDIKTKSYKAPLDTLAFVPVTLKLAKPTVRGNTTATIPLTLETELAGDVFHGFEISVLYDENCVRFLKIEAPPGTLLNSSLFTTTPIPGGILIKTTDKKIINGAGVLAELSFKASDPDGKDTIHCPVRFANWKFDAGCFKPVLKDGEICIIPRQPIVTCNIMAPTSLTWVRSMKDYNPNPFTASITLNNVGDREAKNVRFRIIYNKIDLTLAAPTSDTQNGNPVTMDPGGISEAHWDILAKRRIIGDSVNICIIATFDNHDSVKCCTKVWVPPSDPVLACNATAPKITLDTINWRYVPMPFGVLLDVWNEGGKRTDTVFARIVLPPGDLRLAGADAPNRNTKKVTPPILNPGQGGGVEWFLSHPITLTGKEYNVGFWVRTSNGDSSYCEVKIVIPGLHAPILSPKCAVPDSLTFNQLMGTYVPNPFQVALTCVNVGVLPASNVTGFLYLPANVELVNPVTDSLQKTFNPSTLDQYKAGDSIPKLTWNVRLTKQFKTDTTLVFKFIVGGLGPTGIPADSVEVKCEVKIVIPAIQAPILSPLCEMPDSLSFNEALDTYVPNPFQVALKCKNVGGLPASNVTAFLYLPANVELVNPVTDSLRKTFNPSTLDQYKAGDPIPRLTWTVRYTKRLRYDTRLMFKGIVGGVGLTGVPTDSAEHWCYVRVPGLLPSFDCDISMPDSCGINSSKTDVEPNPFPVRYRVWNKSPQTGKIIQVDLFLPNGEGLSLNLATPFKTLYPNITLKPGDTVTYNWLVNIQKSISRRNSRITVIAYDDEGNPISCEKKIVIPATPASLSCAIRPDNFQILYDRDKKEYVPKEWVISQSLTAGAIPLNNVRATISWTDPSGLNLVDWNPAFPDNTNPKLRSFLQANDSVLFEWGFMMKNPNTSGQKQTITFEVAYSSDETPPSPQQKCSAVAVIDTQVTVGVGKSGKELSYCLYQNHPNPFNPSTVIEYEVPEVIHVRLVVYDALGREVRTLVNERKEAGRHGIVLNSGDLPSGVYTYRLETMDFTQSRQFVLMK